MRRAAFLIATVGLISGCATTPVPLTSAKPVPANRLLAFQAPVDGKTATIAVVRDEGFTGGGCFLGLYLNGVLAARMDVSEGARFHVNPGEVLLRVSWDPKGSGLCGFGSGEWKQIESLVRLNEEKSFRLSINPTGGLDIMRSDP